MRIIARLNTGGPSTHTLILTEWLDPDRFETKLIVGAVPSHEGDMTHRAMERNLPFIQLGSMGRDIKILGDVVSFLKILSIVFKFKPDVIHSHTAKAGALGRLVGFIYNLAVLPRNRCILIHTFHGHVFHSYFSRIKIGIYILIEKMLGLATHRAVVVSQRQKEEIGNEFRILQPERISVVRLGIYMDPFIRIDKSSGGFRKEFDIGAADLTIGAVGRLTNIKNLTMFLGAARTILEKRKTENIYFIVAGDGDVRERLESLAAKLGISGRTIFLGWVDDLPRLYADLDIVALTSLNEGTPLSLIEAMASGRPVAATDVGGVRDLMGSVVRQGSVSIHEHGILVSSEDEESFADALGTLVDDKEMRRQMGERGRDFAFSTYGHKRLVKDIEELYQDTMNEKGSIFPGFRGKRRT